MSREHWAETPLSQLLESLESGSRPKGGVKGITEGIPSIGAEHLASDGGFNFENIRFIPNEFANSMNRGQIKLLDILVVKDGATTGKTSFVRETFPFPKACVNEHVFICRTFNIISKEFIFHYLKSHEGQEYIMSTFHGAAQGGISSGFADVVMVPLPPLPEQKRIVEKLDAILPKVKNVKARLDKIPSILKKFRQSVLAAACSGKLTEDLTTGSVTVIANEEVKGIYEIPSDWNWGTLNSICDKSRGICYGVIKLGKDITDGVPCLRTSDVRSLFLDLNKVKKISKSISDDYQRSILKGGEILVNVRGTLGGVVVVPNELMGWNISREVALVPVINVNPKFYAYCIATSNSQKWLTSVTKGVAYQGINLEDLRLLPVPILSIEEQDEIVRRVEKLFKLADSLEAKYKKAMERVEKIEQSVLAKAFRGELAEQDPNDEPAEELLKRILAEKAKRKRIGSEK